MYLWFGGFVMSNPLSWSLEEEERSFCLEWIVSNRENLYRFARSLSSVKFLLEEANESQFCTSCSETYSFDVSSQNEWDYPNNKHITSLLTHNDITSLLWKLSTPNTNLSWLLLIFKSYWMRRNALSLLVLTHPSSHHHLYIQISQMEQRSTIPSTEDQVRQQ